MSLSEEPTRNAGSKSPVRLRSPYQNRLKWSRFALVIMAFLLMPVFPLVDGRVPAGSCYASTPKDDDLPAEEEQENADDGSSMLQDDDKRFSMDRLIPITMSEEEALLGNWGDEEEEDSD